MKILCTLLLSSLSLPLLAQTYTPKAIVIDGPVDKDEALRVSRLAPGTMTKEQIEAGLGRLADTGMYSDLSYKVDGSALTILLKPSAAAQLEPVVYANFIWWKPGELEPLVEARVPGYHGKLAAAGTMTQQVEDALTALLHEKGVDSVKIESRETRASGASTTLSITTPSITIGKFELQHGVPALEKNIAGFGITLRDEDFDIGETTKSIQDSVNDMYQNAGYLDVRTSIPIYSPPQKTAKGYTVDVTATVSPGEIYHVAAMNISPAPPVSLSDLAKASGIKAGDPASPAGLRLAKGEMEKEYRENAFLDAKAAIATAKDGTAHTVTYSASFEPGQPYHFAQLDLSMLAPSQQAAFTKAFHVSAGAPADKNFSNTLRGAALEAHMGLVIFSQIPNRTDHSVTIAIKPPAARP